MDFCHRSMREYFVARAVCNMLENDLEEAGEFFKSCFLSHEMLFFAGEIMKHRHFDYESNLLKLIDKTIKLLTFNQEGQTVEAPKEFKMTLQCQGMNIDGVIREKIEGKRLQELIDKAVLT